MIIRHDLLKGIKEQSLDAKYALLKRIKKAKWLVTLIKAVEIISFLETHMLRIREMRQLGFQRILACLRI